MSRSSKIRILQFLPANASGCFSKHFQKTSCDFAVLGARSTKKPAVVPENDDGY